MHRLCIKYNNPIIEGIITLFCIIRSVVAALKPKVLRQQVRSATVKLQFRANWLRAYPSVQTIQPHDCRRHRGLPSTRCCVIGCRWCTENIDLSNTGQGNWMPRHADDMGLKCRSKQHFSERYVVNAPLLISLSRLSVRLSVTRLRYD